MSGRPAAFDVDFNWIRHGRRTSLMEKSSARMSAPFQFAAVIDQPVHDVRAGHIPP
jgi:hypothetical protein